MEHNGQEVISGHMAVGVEWNYSQDGLNVYLAPEIWRWDSMDTDDGQAFDEWLNEPSGTWQGYYDISWGSGSGWRKVDTFSTRTYPRRQSTYTVSLRVQWYDATGTYYDGSFHRAGFGYRDWYATIPALESHTVRFDANGGTGAPADQTKWYGSVLTLSSTVPTKANHEFQGWALNSATGTDIYPAGSLYGLDQDATFYAVWKLVSNPPTVKMEITRCDSSYAADGEGTYAKATVTWGVDTATVSTNVGKTVEVEWSPSTGASSKSVSISGTSGTATVQLGGGFDGGTVYTLTASVTDSLGLTTTTATQKLGSIFHTFDIGNAGKSMGLGAMASDSSTELKVGFDAFTLATSDVAGTVKDAIVARGSSGIWDFMKYANGVCWCWCKKSASPSNSHASIDVAYPFTIYGANCHVSVYQSGTIGVTAQYTSSDNDSKVNAWASCSNSAGSVVFSVLVVGKWKG